MLESRIFALPPPAPDLKLVIVIPCHAEPDILATLNSLALCRPPQGDIEVIVVVNGSSNQTETVRQQNQDSLSQMALWQQENQAQLPFTLYWLDCELPPKHAGVGLARRIGMDLAAERLFSVGCPEGVIVNLDADCTVAPNYFLALEAHFNAHSRTPGASIWFEHPLSGALDPAIYQAISYYELFLRYHINGLRFAGLPSAFQTIGSAMAVRAKIYRAQGGMNRRKAGEDFYFLQKIIALGGFTEVNTTAVYPSPRVSERVPFGTGKAVGDWLKHQQGYFSYALQTYLDLKVMLQGLTQLYAQGLNFIPQYLAGLSSPLQAYVETVTGSEKLEEIFANSASEASFRKRFFQWFDGFQAMKCAHFLRDQAYGEPALIGQSLALLKYLEPLEPVSSSENIQKVLERYRALDRRWAA